MTKPMREITGWKSALALLLLALTAFSTWFKERWIIRYLPIHRYGPYETKPAAQKQDSANRKVA